MTEHAKTPWETDEELNYETIISKDGIMVADCSILHPKRMKDICKANAEFIVKACNSYDKFVKALEAIAIQSPDKKAVKTAEEALANATE